MLLLGTSKGDWEFGPVLKAELDDEYPAFAGAVGRAKNELRFGCCEEPKVVASGFLPRSSKILLSFFSRGLLKISLKMPDGLLEVPESTTPSLVEAFAPVLLVKIFSQLDSKEEDDSPEEIMLVVVWFCDENRFVWAPVVFGAELRSGSPNICSIVGTCKISAGVARRRRFRSSEGFRMLLRGTGAAAGGGYVVSGMSEWKSEKGDCAERLGSCGCGAWAAGTGALGTDLPSGVEYIICCPESADCACINRGRQRTKPAKSGPVHFPK